MIDYPLEIIDNHSIVTFGDAVVLIDTGSPRSFCEKPLNIMGQSYSLDSSFATINAPQLTKAIGRPIDGLVGEDILSTFYFLIDWSLPSFRVSQEMLAHQGSLLSVETYSTIPHFPITIQGKAQRAFLDTGAKVSYLNSALIEGDPFAETEDFYPGLGAFTAPVYKVPVTVAGDSFDIEFGRLPKTLEETLLAKDVLAVVGSDLFRRYAISFSMKNKLVVLRSFSSPLGHGVSPAHTREPQ